MSQKETSAVIALVETSLEELRKDKKGIEDWLHYRDLALVGVMLGGGLKVSHVVRLSLNCIDLNEQTIDLSLPNQAHRAVLFGFATDALAAWLSIQEILHGGKLLPTQKVFEACRLRGFGRYDKKVTLSASSIHRRTERLLGMAGISGERASAQTLRNTYAALLINSGASDAHLIDALGLKLAATAQRLRITYLNQQEKP